MTTDVCVIIAAKNAEATIARAVASALAEPESAEVVVIDDGSSDETEAAMNAAWQDLTGTRAGRPVILTVLGRKLVVPQAARGVARFAFADLCEQPLAASDYLALARDFHTVLIDHVPLLTADLRDAARRFTLLIDTFYDEGVKLIASAAAAPEALYGGNGGPGDTVGEAFRRTASRLAEMQSEDYLKRGHGLHQFHPGGGTGE